MQPFVMQNAEHAFVADYNDLVLHGFQYYTWQYVLC